MKFDRFHIALVMASIIMVIHLRIAPFFDTSLPVNDGGLFYRMVIDLQDNSYRLPQYTSYNNNSIPFAYPPLPFYLLGLLQAVFSADLMTLFRFLPLALNLITIPFVFLLFTLLVGNRKIGLIAVLIWGICIPSYAWLIMGGGVTRSLAMLASIASLYFTIRYVRDGKIPFLMLGGILGGITGLTHLEIFWVNCISLLILVFFQTSSTGRKLSTIGVYAAITISMLTPYLIHLWKNHALAPLISGFLAGEYSAVYSLMKLLMFNFTEEYGITILAVIALCSFFYHVTIKKDYLAAIWFIALVILDPRSVNRSAMLPLALLAAAGLFDLVACIREHILRSGSVQYDRIKKALPLLIPGIGFVLFSQVYVLNFLYENYISSMLDSLTQEDMETVEWVNNHVAPESKFLLITPAETWQIDHFSEWFPALTKQSSILTVQGTEWISSAEYAGKRKESEIMRSCANIGLACYQSEIYRWDADYVLVNHEDCVGQRICLNDLDSWLTDSSEYQKIYSSDSHSIFRVLEFSKQME